MSRKQSFFFFHSIINTALEIFAVFFSKYLNMTYRSSVSVYLQIGLIYITYLVDERGMTDFTHI